LSLQIADQRFATPLTFGISSKPCDCFFRLDGA